MTDPADTHWKRDPRLLPVVNLLRKEWSLTIQSAVDQTSCFGSFVLPPPEGPCDQAATCDLSVYCQRACDAASLQAADSVRASAPEAPKEVASAYARPMFDGTAKVRSLVRKNRANAGLYRGTDKYKREGYTPLGRHVDLLLAAFKEALPPLPMMPLVWSANQFEKNFASLGSFVMSATASYHTILRDGVVLVRFWTNTVRTAIVDILPELAEPLKQVSAKLGKYRYRKSVQLAQMDPPIPVPPRSWLKVRPCTHRVIVRTPDAAREVAKLVRTYWRIGN